jgi:hypothetical protein
VIARLIAALLALLTAAAVRAPHHDDELHVVTRVGTWTAERGWAVIDQGGVGFMGEPCAHLHLAAHRTSHGGPFGRIPELQPGDLVTVWASVECTYRIDSEGPTTSNLEPPFGDLLMQTSWPGGFFLLYGTRV